MATYEASRLSSGNRLFPNKLEINNDGVIFYKGGFIGYKTIYINKESIGSVSVNAGLLFSTITVESNGGKVIVAEGFTNSDAEEIRNALT